MKPIDDFLNPITMYRLVVYGLGLLLAVAVVFGLIGRLALSPKTIITSTAVILVSSYAVNKLLARIWDIPTNSESWLITGLILALILQPATDGFHYLVLFLAAAIATASKFALAPRGKHIFNPAALAAAIVSFTAIGQVSWWVGNSLMWPFTLAFGLLVVRKIRRFPMVITFSVVAIAVQVISDQLAGRPVMHDLHTALISSPLIFLATIMLTEPATMPPRRVQQLIFGAGIAVLYATGWNLGPLYVYPEVALIIGNLYAYAVSPKFRLRLKLVEIQRISDRVYNYVFQPDRKLSFLPGQYMEWTLADVPFDDRGNRRTFTIASSPTEATVQVGLKYYQPSSAYKTIFQGLKPGDAVYASQLAGNFTLSGHEDQKLVFIAGGIGITPFRSMVKYLVDEQRSFDAVLIYLLSDRSELAYEAEFAAAKALGLKVKLVVPEPSPNGRMTAAKLGKELIAETVPDYAERLFFISGPNTMVDASKRYLRELGVSRSRIKTDHFSGY